jgi:hypothetical protein
MTKIDRFGICFDNNIRKGDIFYYVWPWKRPSFNKRIYSMSFYAYFTSLKKLDKMWEDYWKEAFIR